MTTHNDIPCVGNTSACRPPKRSEFITIRVSSTLKEQLSALADQRERSLSWLVNSILEEFFKGKQTTKQRE